MFEKVFFHFYRSTQFTDHIMDLNLVFFRSDMSNDSKLKRHYVKYMLYLSNTVCQIRTNRKALPLLHIVRARARYIISFINIIKYT